MIAPSFFSREKSFAETKRLSKLRNETKRAFYPFLSEKRNFRWRAGNSKYIKQTTMSESCSSNIISYFHILNLLVDTGYGTNKVFY
jgi:hypothetical protein